MYRTRDRMEHARGLDGFVRRRPADPVLIADAHTSMCDYRIALAQALGRHCDRNGYMGAARPSDTTTGGDAA